MQQTHNCIQQWKTSWKYDYICVVAIDEIKTCLLFSEVKRCGKMNIIKHTHTHNVMFDIFRITGNAFPLLKKGQTNSYTIEMELKSAINSLLNNS